MKVFISWSGEKSKKYAECIKEWIETCIQSVTVFFSSNDIEKGKNWNITLNNELSESGFGIVCLTEENFNAPWISYEAGVLSRSLSAKVTAIATDINISKIQGPLATFQATKLERADLYNLLKSINKELENPLEESRLEKIFSTFYNELEEKIEAIEKEFKSKKRNSINKENNVTPIDEILQITRNIFSLVNNPDRILPPDYIEYLFRGRFPINSKSDDKIMELIYSFIKDLLITTLTLEIEEYSDFICSKVNVFVEYLSNMNPLWSKRIEGLLNKIEMERSIKRKPRSKSKLISNKK